MVPSTSFPPTVGIDGACELLGGICRRTLLRYTRRPRDPMPYLKLSPGNRGTVVFVVSDVIEWLRRQQKRPPARKTRAARAKSIPRSAK